jgi:hypothetical protein
MYQRWMVVQNRKDGKFYLEKAIGYSNDVAAYQKLYESEEGAIADCKKTNQDLGSDYFSVVEVSVEVV